jgi:hypothetical protein
MTVSPPLARVTPRPSSGRRLLAVLAIGAIVLALSLALGLRALHGGASGSAVSGGASEGGLSGAAPGGRGSSDAPSGQSGDTGAKAPAAGFGATPGSGPPVSSAVIGARIARSAWLGIKVRDLSGAAARARVIATGAGGQVTSENVVTSLDPTGGGDAVGGASNGAVKGVGGAVAPSTEPDARSSLPAVGVDEARMVLNVPAKALDEVLTDLSKIGAVSYRSSQSQDVTDTYVDTKARIGPMSDGLERVRALLAKATDLQQIITLESELSRRQADLDSLTQRLAQLDQMTTTSDVTVTLWTDATTPADPGNGLGAGLRGAWESLLGSLTVILTGLAALLPWLLLLVPLTLVGLRLWRRRTAPATHSPVARGPAAAVPAAATATGPAPAPAPPPVVPSRPSRRPSENPAHDPPEDPSSSD